GIGLHMDESFGNGEIGRSVDSRRGGVNQVGGMFQPAFFDPPEQVSAHPDIVLLRQIGQGSAKVGEGGGRLGGHVQNGAGAVGAHSSAQRWYACSVRFEEGPVSPAQLFSRPYSRVQVRERNSAASCDHITPATPSGMV